MRSIKKFLIICFILLVVFIACYYLYYSAGVNIDLFNKEVNTFMKTDEDKI